ncbi:PREDICTED: uncharacterized protein LOC109346992 [Lupinus angustifolius]|uniref:uncharacterized protein LOC109346992 n=1 Tax=Lupinus angustifolius TaxID=3871 RepID=UPI00092F4123|nr:PREDICTED: uncharacterized protein LOC109346992 [Lupinus angustifolius]
MELDISCYKYGINNATSPVSDIDIKALSLALTKLHKVKLSGNHLINNSLYFHLCKKGELLENVALTRCEIISQDGIASAIKERPNLTSISVINRKSQISSPPLRKLLLQGIRDYSYAGIYCLFSKCQFVQHMDLYHGAEFLEDEQIRELPMLLRNLMHINLSGCYNRTAISFFALIMNCPLLNEIIMEETYLGEIEVLDSFADPWVDTDIIVNFQVKSLHLSSNTRLRDENIEMFA